MHLALQDYEEQSQGNRQILETIGQLGEITQQVKDSSLMNEVSRFKAE